MTAPMFGSLTMESVPPCRADEPFGNGQAKPQPLLLLHRAVKLHVSAHARDLLGGKPAALVTDGKVMALKASLSVRCGRASRDRKT